MAASKDPISKETVSKETIVSKISAQKTAAKEALAQAYDQDARRRASKSLPEWKLVVRETFASRLGEESKSKLLEIGSGPGIDGVYFQGNGLDVTCIDLSPESVKICTEKGLRAEVMDFYNLSFQDQSFDAVYALNCLLHIPKKDFAEVLQEIHRVMNPGALFFIGLYGGESFEGIWEQDWCEPKRFFAMYTDGEIREAVAPYFRIEQFATVFLGNDEPHFQGLTLRKI